MKGREEMGLKEEEGEEEKRVDWRESDLIN